MPRFHAQLAAASFLMAACATPEARIFFAGRQALTAEREIALTVWRTEGHGSQPDPDWDCQGGPYALGLSACEVGPYRTFPSPGRDEYLVGAFLALKPFAKPEDLAPIDRGHYAWFDSLTRPHIALKKTGDSCLFLIHYNRAYAPVAGGQVSCPSLATALKEVLADVGHLGSFDAGPPPRSASKVVREPPRYSQAEAGREAGLGLDLGLDAGVALVLGFSTTEQTGAGPYAQEIKQFDFNDFAEVDLAPLSARASLMFNNTFGIRGGFAYSRFVMTEDVKRQINSSIAPDVIQEWNITRKDWSADLIVGKAFQEAKGTVILFGSFGFVSVDFAESAWINGVEDDVAGFLDDVFGLWLGAGFETKLPYFSFALEPGVLIKSFKMREATEQPNGTGSEFQLRLRLGSWYRLLK